jgi:hypothetical protein
MAEKTQSEGVGLTLRGVLSDEGPDSITLQVGASQFEIPRNYLLNLREVMEGHDGKIVEAKVAADAQIIQRVLASASTVTRRPILAAACDCACNCNCACECACGGGGKSIQSVQQSAFRSRFAESA